MPWVSAVDIACRISIEEREAFIWDVCYVNWRMHNFTVIWLSFWICILNIIAFDWSDNCNVSSRLRDRRLHNSPAVISKLIPSTLVEHCTVRIVVVFHELDLNQRLAGVTDKATLLNIAASPHSAPLASLSSEACCIVKPIHHHTVVMVKELLCLD